MKKAAIILALLTILGFFFSRKLLEVPPGLTVDEAAFGYNAVLLSRTLHDENGKLLPFFVLSIEGKDWRQPVTQYYLAGFFKLFGASVFNLRFSSVIITIASAVLIFLLGKYLHNLRLGIFSAVAFLLSPIVMIQSHMALDNIMPVLFTTLWLLFLLLYQKTKNLKFLVFCGIFLGINFYTYKGMRGAVPLWTILTSFYVFFTLSKRKFKPLYYFLLGVLPFFAIIPYLSDKYPGAIFGGARPWGTKWYEFFYPYLSSFDFSFLYLTGDATPYHSTGRHGMLLLATLPFFLLGVYKSIQKKDFFLFLLASFVIAPLFYGFVASVHRASRLLFILPSYAIISGLGFLTLYESRKFLFKTLFLVAVILNFANYYDFVKYYWYEYPKAADQFFGKIEVHNSYKILSEGAKKKNLTPYIAEDLFKADGEIGKFYKALYFDSNVVIWPEVDKATPGGSLLLSSRENVPGMSRSALNLAHYYLHERP